MYISVLLALTTFMQYLMARTQLYILTGIFDSAQDEKILKQSSACSDAQLKLWQLLWEVMWCFYMVFSISLQDSFS